MCCLLPLPCFHSRLQSFPSRVPALLTEPSHNSMEAFVWVVAYPEGARRMNVRGRSVRLKFPQPSWLQARCEDLSVERAVLGKHEHVVMRVVGVAAIKRGKVYNGPLTNFTQEEATLFEYFQRSRDMISYEVTGVCALDSPHLIASCSTVAVIHRQGRHRDRVGAQSMYTAGHPCAYPVENLLAMNPRVAEWVRNQDSSNRYTQGQDIMMLQVPHQVAHLIMAGSWKVIGVLGRWCLEVKCRHTCGNLARERPRAGETESGTVRAWHRFGVAGVC